MDDYILVKSRQTELAEIETEDDGTVSLESLRCHLGQRIVSLKYQNEKTGLDRYLRVTEDRFQPPRDGWGGRTYTAVTLDERDGSGNHESKAQLSPSSKSLHRHPMIKLEPQLSCELETEPVQDLEVKAEDVPELTKKETLLKMKTSAVARTAVYQWNKMNTAVRILVHQTTFHGSAGMLTCNGTTKEEALANQRLRESIASHDSVKRLFGVFYLEDRSGKVTLDQFKALEHVRHVLNELRRTSKPRKATETMQTKPSGLEENKTVDNIGTTDVCTISSPKRIKKTTTSANSVKRKAIKNMGKENKRVRKESEKSIDEIDDDRSDYERQIDVRRHENEVIKHQLGLTGKPKLPDKDAVVVARAWFPLQQKITVQKVEEESEEYGLLPPPKGAKLRETLIHFGNELVDNECVTLKQPAGLTRSDITKLLD